MIRYPIKYDMTIDMTGASQETLIIIEHYYQKIFLKIVSLLIDI